MIYELAQNDSQLALKHLFLHFYSRLIVFASYYVKSKETCEEIVSDTFLAIWRQRKQLQDKQNVQSYIYVITRNVSVDYARRFGNNKNIDISELDHILKEQANPESELISSELMSEFDSIVESLPTKCKIAFKLVREHNMKYKEAAYILNISEKTLEAHMAKAVKYIRGMLNVKKK